MNEIKKIKKIISRLGVNFLSNSSIMQFISCLTSIWLKDIMMTHKEYSLRFYINTYLFSLLETNIFQTEWLWPLNSRRNSMTGYILSVVLTSVTCTDSGHVMYNTAIPVMKFGDTKLDRSHWFFYQIEPLKNGSSLILPYSIARNS